VTTVLCRDSANVSFFPLFQGCVFCFCWSRFLLFFLVSLLLLCLWWSLNKISFASSPFVIGYLASDGVTVLTDDAGCPFYVEAHEFKNVLILSVAHEATVFPEDLGFKIVNFCFSHSSCCEKWSHVVDQQWSKERRKDHLAQVKVARLNSVFEVAHVLRNVILGNLKRFLSYARYRESQVFDVVLYLDTTDFLKVFELSCRTWFATSSGLGVSRRSWGLIVKKWFIQLPLWCQLWLAIHQRMLTAYLSSLDPLVQQCSQ